MLDTPRLKQSWGRVAQHGDQVPLYFYSTLFLMYPQTRALFPVSMAAQRDRLVGALGRTVSNVDKLDELVPFLQQLGRDHRKFQVTPEHYPAVGAALLATLEHFLGPQWDDDLAEAWTNAFGVIADVMVAAAEEGSRETPPWWDAEVVAREQRTFDITVLTVKPGYHFSYRPGQSVAVETSLRPKLWRYYSPANAPRPDNSLELHVRQVPGGSVSTALGQLVQVGDTVRLGAPVGDRLTLPSHDEGDDLLLLAGGTGLAPLRAIAEQVAADRTDRRVSLFHGVRTRRELYDLKALTELQERCARLTVVPVLSDDPLRGENRSTVVDAALKQGRWRGHRIHVCGSEQMVRGTVERLSAAGVARERIHVEEFHSTAHPPALDGTASSGEPA